MRLYILCKRRRISRYIFILKSFSYHKRRTATNINKFILWKVTNQTITTILCYFSDNSDCESQDNSQSTFKQRPAISTASSDTIKWLCCWTTKKKKEKNEKVLHLFNKIHRHGRAQSPPPKENPKNNWQKCGSAKRTVSVLLERNLLFKSLRFFLNPL